MTPASPNHHPVSDGRVVRPCRTCVARSNYPLPLRVRGVIKDRHSLPSPYGGAEVYHVFSR